VITGIGIISSIGCNSGAVLEALQESRSGMVFMQAMQEMGFNCCVYAPIKDWDPGRLPKRAKLTMSTVAQYASSAALEALQDAELKPEDLQNERSGIIVGSSFGGINEPYRIEQLIVTRKNPSRAGATGVVKTMNSSAAGNLAASLGVLGRTYSISSTFSSGIDNIGHGFELIKHGLQDLCVCGAAEEDCWKQIGVFIDNWSGMPRDWNHKPEDACRPYDRDRQGTVLSAGAGILVLESLEHAQRRNARIYAEIVGYGSTNDGRDMFEPSGQGLTRAIQQALNSANGLGASQIDYINTHGTGTKKGDRVEVRVLKDLFAQRPLVSSTKGLAGHGLGATGAQEAIYTLLMLHNNFVAPTKNLENIAPECAGISHVQALIEKKLSNILCINVGLAGSNSCIIFRKI
jgi:3-oxoacyl-[acyl-carrier-protein] synthase-1